MSAKVKIEIKDLKKSFNNKDVLSGIDLNIMQGESLVILGGSGSGKSVLIKTIIGLITPDSGSIKLDDQEITKLSANEYNKVIKKFGFLFQGGALFDSLTIWENISFALIHTQKISKKKARNHAIEKLMQVGLEENVANLQDVPRLYIDEVEETEWNTQPPKLTNIIVVFLFFPSKS